MVYNPHHLGFLASQGEQSQHAQHRQYLRLHRLATEHPWHPI